MLKRFVYACIACQMAVLSGSIVFAGAAALSTTRSDGRPNLLVILADDLGYADLGCCGANDLRTPHIDRLFAAGMRFTHGYASCPVCSPTRAALLSGCYPDLIGVPGVIRTHPENSWGYLSQSPPLLPEFAKQQGYRTAIIGKWHLGLESPNLPNERGFDHFHGFLGDMMDDYQTHRRHDVNYMRLNDQTIDPPGHATDLFSEWAVDFLDQQTPQQPFLLYLAWNAPHTPIQPAAEWLQRVRASRPELPEKRAALAALIEHMDEGVGRVLSVLESRGLSENTIVVFTSDNGGQLDVGANNGPLRDGKQSVYEGGIRVPLCVAWPGHIRPGSVSRFSVLSMDILPTLFDAAQLSIPDARDGRSFLPTLHEEPQPELRSHWIWTRREGGPQFGGKTIEAIREGPWKLLQNSPFGPLELYNLSSDPGETQDVAATNRGTVNRLNAALRVHLQRAGAVPWQPPDRVESGRPRVP